MFPNRSKSAGPGVLIALGMLSVAVSPLTAVPFWQHPNVSAALPGPSAPGVGFIVDLDEVQEEFPQANIWFGDGLVGYFANEWRAPVWTAMASLVITDDPYAISDPPYVPPPGPPPLVPPVPPIPPVPPGPGGPDPTPGPGPTPQVPLNPVPEPRSLAVLGAVLCAAAMLARKRH